ncbi:MAG: hypothetical protein U5S82_09900 [Gammaproteobacteria bacterium]|nr:hypothetical protein [Gammaproteobacteria bacterium]
MHTILPPLAQPTGRTTSPAGGGEFRYSGFRSRQETNFANKANKMLSAMREQFGDHIEQGTRDLD